MDKSELSEYFCKSKHSDKERLLDNYNKKTVKVAECHGFFDYLFGTTAPSTGFIMTKPENTDALASCDEWLTNKSQPKLATNC